MRSEAANPLEPSCPAQPARVLAVDDHPVVRQGLAGLLDRQPDLCLCGEAEDAPEAMEAIDRHDPDLVIVDIRLRTGNGLALVKDIRARFGGLPVLVCSMLEESAYVDRALRAGANGYVSKEEPGSKLLEAIRKVLAGRVHVGRESAERLIRSGTGSGQRGPEALSGREREVFRLLGQGLPRRQIAARLAVSVHTVDTYLGRLKSKLQLPSVARLVQAAVQWARDEL